MVIFTTQPSVLKSNLNVVGLGTERFLLMTSLSLLAILQLRDYRSTRCCSVMTVIGLEIMVGLCF